MKKLAERAYAHVVEAERLRLRMEGLADSLNAEIVERTFVADWINAAAEATRLCQSANTILPDQDVLDLKHRIEAIERGLWGNYIDAEWLTWPLWLIENGLLHSNEEEADTSFC